MDWPKIVRRCFESDRVYYSGHARREMRAEEFGPIADQEVFEAIGTAEVVEVYPEDRPFPSALLLGWTTTKRPLHVVCAYDEAEDHTVIVTVYQPDPTRWEEFRRRTR